MFLRICINEGIVILVLGFIEYLTLSCDDQLTKASSTYRARLCNINSIKASVDCVAYLIYKLQEIGSTGQKYSRMHVK